MTQITVRPYDHGADYDRVLRFLGEVYRPGKRPLNWLPPRWEYMHFHPLIEGLAVDRIGVATDGGHIAGVAHFEHHPAMNYLQRRPDRPDVIGPLLDHAQARLGGHHDAFGRAILGVYVHDFDGDLKREVRTRGFRRHDEFIEDHSLIALDQLPDVPAPAGFRVQSLADENDLAKVNRVLWRGFNHPGPAPAEEVPGRRRSQAAPNFHEDLNIVAVAPDGEYAAYAGMWLVAEHGVGYVEPVATDPDYRRLGLGRAAVLEGLRRLRAAGATVAWVGSDLPFYRALGFVRQFSSRLWYR